MPLSLNTWYRIAFPNQEKPDLVFATVYDDPDDVDIDCVVLELESSTDLKIEKLGMVSQSGQSVALCSNALACISGVERPVEIDVDIVSQIVWTPDLPDVYDWLPPVEGGMQQLTLFFTLIDEGEEVHPCDAEQPHHAEPVEDPARGTVGAYPMVFTFPGVVEEGGNNTGKKIKIIWKKDI